MRRALARTVGALVVVASVVGAAASAAAAEATPQAPAASPQAAAPVPAPRPVLPPGGAFGPGWDPTRPPPVEPTESGPGIVSASLLAAGPAEVEGLRGENRSGVSPYFGVALDVEIAAGSTTKLLGAASVVAQPDEGEPLPLLVACTPTMDNPVAVHHGPGVGLSAWNIAIDGRTWFCGGRTARLAIETRDSGFRLTSESGTAWKGPMVLLFQSQASAPRRVVLAGVTVELPQRAKSDSKAN